MHICRKRSCHSFLSLRQTVAILFSLTEEDICCFRRLHRVTLWRPRKFTVWVYIEQRSPPGKLLSIATPSLFSWTSVNPFFVLSNSLLAKGFFLQSHTQNADSLHSPHGAGCVAIAWITCSSNRNTTPRSSEWICWQYDACNEARQHLLRAESAS